MHRNSGCLHRKSGYIEIYTSGRGAPQLRSTYNPTRDAYNPTYDAYIKFRSVTHFTCQFSTRLQRKPIVIVLQS